MSDIMSISQKPITIEKTSSLSHVISELLKNKISRLIVTEDGTSVGIITEKDIGLFLLEDDSDKYLDEIPASQIMHMLTSVDESMSVENCIEIMLEKQIGSLGVTSNSNGLIGIITKTDIAQYYIKKYSKTNTVGDVMTISYISMNHDATLRHVVSELIDKKISRIFIKNENGEPQGILTFRDLFHVALEQGNTDSVLDSSDPAISVVFTRKGFLSDSGFGNTIQAKDVMTKTFESVDFDEDLTVACEEMIQNKINGVGVRINGKLGGVVSKTDILKAIYINNKPK
ncbi:MAG: CBS domain-containing protein [Nitrosopumilus sp.]|nr:CBS domain-containing protein [Nitrosopumilus sp.]MDH3515441.1 CBS domain-containing protein [Nitrosopumilus sp.]MDH3564258.1 CBS domain-containing protein [Nitrosopumilus sp.]MDH5416605.1 CBS domain-containing protein [Nitrosopumilus sp.]MDH5555128.1 CBS domain-containing protein [Nitrosopumilus sp.]